MHKEQQRQHLKSNDNIISKLAVIVLSIVLLTGISLVPALQIGVNGQVQQQHNNKSYAYDKILLPRFDRHIEITNNNSNTKINLLDVKMYGNNNCKNCSRSLLLEETDLKIIPDPTSDFFMHE